jgi:predicted TIM-barrel fold metal-dependent hydrolase
MNNAYIGILKGLAAGSNMIDSHVHVWTDKIKKYPRVPSGLDYAPPRFTPEDFFCRARSSGVRRAVLIQMSFYGYNNSYMLDSMRAHPAVFSGIAIVDSSAPEPESAMKKLARKGVRGFRIQPGDSPRAWLDASGMQAMWRCGAQEQLAMCPLLNPDALAFVDRMCAKYPETPVVIDHLARIGADGQIRDSDIRLLCGLAKHRKVSVKVSAFYALGRKQAPYRDLAPFIRRVFEDFGPHRLMWGSDSPFQVQGGHTYAASAALIDEGLPFASSEDKSWMLEKTAESLFFSGGCQ